MLVYRVTATIPTNNRVVVGGFLNQNLSFESAKNLAISVERIRFTRILPMFRLSIGK